MNSCGYKSAPLSDEMERRIEERLAACHREIAPLRQDRESCGELQHELKLGYFRAGVATLEWVLREAEALKSEVINCGIRRV
jgi:hypothetical protein